MIRPFMLGVVGFVVAAFLACIGYGVVSQFSYEEWNRGYKCGHYSIGCPNWVVR